MSFKVHNNYFLSISVILIALGITLGTGTLYRFIYSYNMIMAATLMIMLAVIVYQQFIPVTSNGPNPTYSLNQKYSYSGIILIAFMIFIPLFSDIINEVSSHEIVYFYTAMIIFSFLLDRELRERILNIYLIIIVVLSAISFIFIFFFYFTDILSTLPHIKLRSHFNPNFYYVSTINTSAIWLRNQSIFWEPGAYGFHLIISTLLAYKKGNKIFISILLIACITTFSTTVFIFLILLGGYHILYSKTKLKTILWIFSIISIVILSILIITKDNLILQLMYQALFDKFSPTSRSFISFAGRALFTIEALKVFFENIIIGIGHYGTAEQLEVVKSGVTVNSSGLVGLLAELGLFGMFCIILYIRFFWRFSIIAIPITLVWLNGEFLQYSPLAFFILAHSADELSNKLFPSRIVKYSTI